MFLLELRAWIPNLLYSFLIFVGLKRSGKELLVTCSGEHGRVSITRILCGQQWQYVIVWHAQFKLKLCQTKYFLEVVEPRQELQMVWVQCGTGIQGSLAKSRPTSRCHGLGCHREWHPFSWHGLGRSTRSKHTWSP